mgnify:CR=1 FL=1
MRTFVLNEKHIKLLRHSYVSWDSTEYGAAGIDPKRPYGNSDVLKDIVKILFGDLPEKTIKDLSEYANQIHGETKTALQIILTTGKFEPGIYVADDYSDRSWKKEEAK